MFKAGLAYKKEAEVNWDPVDKTVLANEQVIDGKGWRSGAVVQKKKLSQWFLKISKYSDELLNELDNLTKWHDCAEEVHLVGNCIDPANIMGTTRQANTAVYRIGA